MNKQNLPQQMQQGNLIERLGGYEAAKKAFYDFYQNRGSLDLDPEIQIGEDSVLIDILDDELLEYRRQNGIFEVGDVVCFRECQLPQFYGGVYKVAGQTMIGVLNDEFVIDDAGNKRRITAKSIRHATTAEIAANRRLPDDMGDDTHIENHVSPLCIRATTKYDWSKVPSQFEWLATSPDCKVWGYTHKPKIVGDNIVDWGLSEDASWADAVDVIPHKDWRDSLEQRPQGVGGEV